MDNNPNSSHDDNADTENLGSSYYGNADPHVTNESPWTFDMDMLGQRFRDMRLQEQDGFPRYVAPCNYGLNANANANGEGCSSWQVLPHAVPRVAGVLVDMMDKPYQIQRFSTLLDCLGYDMRIHIVYLLTRDERRLVELAKDATGVESLKKLIETVKNMPVLRESLTNAFGVRGTFELMKHPIGSELIKHCYAELNYEDTMFILAAARTYFVRLAKDVVGYKSLQLCIDQLRFQHQRFILEEAVRNCCFLTNDKYGNFIIQHVVAKYGNYVLNPISRTTVTDSICYEVGEHLVEFSTDSHGSYVIEKCLKSDRRSYLLKLLVNMDQNTLRRLIQDPWGNYVLQTALKINKGSVFHKLLVRSLSVLPRQLLADLHAQKVMSMVLLEKH